MTNRQHPPQEAMRWRGHLPLAYQNEVRFRPTRVLDADTIEGLVFFPGHVTVPMLDLDFDIDVPMERQIRLEGINAPEKGTPEGQAAKDFVRSWMGWVGAVLLATDNRKEKYGRTLGDLRWNDGASRSLAQTLYEQEMAVLYPPPPRPDPAALLP